MSSGWFLGGLLIPAHAYCFVACMFMVSYCLKFTWFELNLFVYVLSIIAWELNLKLPHDFGPE